MSFANMVTSSVLARALALFILFFVMILAICVGAYDLITARAIPDVVTTIAGAGLGYAVTMLGLNFGVMLSPTPTPAAAPVAQGGSNGTTHA